MSSNPVRALAISGLLFGGAWLTGCDTDKCKGLQCGANQSCEAETGQCVDKTCKPACSGSTPVCDAASLSCKACTATAGCTGATSACDTAANGGAGACVECVSDSDCSGATGVCEANVCVTCTDAKGCSGTTVCDTAAASGKGACVGCVQSADCQGGTPVCKVATQTCVTCLGDGDCSGATPACNTEANACVGCLSDVHCGGATPKCNATAAACVECVSDGDCGIGALCLQNACTRLANSCSNPLDVVFAPGSDVATFTADTTNATNAATGTCGGGPELIYRLTLTQAQDVAFSATGVGSVNPVLFLRSTDCAAGTQLICRNLSGGGGTESFSLFNLAAGDYYLFVESYGNPKGQIAVTVTLSPPSLPPVNDTCAAPEVLTVVPGTPTTFTANTTPATDAESGTCVTTPGSKEVVYEITTTAAHDIVVTAVVAWDVNPALYLRSGTCTGGAEVQCVDATYWGGPETLAAYNQPAGVYYLVVETVWSASGASSGPSDVTVNLNPPTILPTHTTCLSAQALTLPASVSSSTSLVSNDYVVADGCGSSAATGPDLVYSFTTATPGTLVARLTPKTPGYRPTLSVRSLAECTNSTTAVTQGCLTAAYVDHPVDLIISQLAAGTWYLVVDGHTNTHGAFDLTVEHFVLPPLTNDACASAEALTLDGAGNALVEGSTLGLTSTVTTSCGSSSAANADAVYKFTAPALPGGATALQAKVIATGLNADELHPSLSVRTDCATTTTAGQEFCSSSTVAPFVASGIFAPTPGTEYFAVVDATGTSHTAGSFSLEVNVAPVPHPNDSCAAPATLPANTSVPGTTLGATDDMNGWWYTGCTGGSLGGQDVVFAYTASVTGPVKAYVRPQRDFDLALGVLSACAPASCLAFDDQAGVGRPASVTFNASAGATYYLVVDHWDSATFSHSWAGGFIISVTE
jgi:hypothetical protein